MRLYYGSSQQQDMYVIEWILIVLLILFKSKCKYEYGYWDYVYRE